MAKSFIPLINLSGLSTFLAESRNLFTTKEEVNSGITGIEENISNIEEKIPGNASSSNLLVDTNTMNQQMSMMEATFRGNWDNWSDVPDSEESFPGEELNKNDYIVVNDASDYAPEWVSNQSYSAGAIVRHDWSLYRSLDSHNSGHEPEEGGDQYWERIDSNPNYEGTWFFKYTSSANTYDKEKWSPEFQLNEEPFTQAQMDAINSNITSGLVGIMLVASAQTLSIGQQLSARTNINAQENDTKSYSEINCLKINSINGLIPFTAIIHASYTGTDAGAGATYVYDYDGWTKDIVELTHTYSNNEYHWKEINDGEHLTCELYFGNGTTPFNVDIVVFSKNIEEAFNLITSSSTIISTGSDDISTGLQEKLVSGSNIKKINNESLLGFGNITLPFVDGTQGVAKQLTSNGSVGFGANNSVIEGLSSVDAMQQYGWIFVPSAWADVYSAWTLSAETRFSLVKGVASHVEGKDNIAWGNQSHAEGNITVAYGDKSHAEGEETTAWGVRSHAEGFKTTAYGNNSHIEGVSTTTAEDRGITSASTSGAIITEWSASDPSTDKFSLTMGEAAHVEGTNNLALGKNSHAEGNGCLAQSGSSHAEGTGSLALGGYAHAEGRETVASGNSSHAEGETTRTIRKAAHAEGSSTIASGETSHAEGSATTAVGYCSHAEGKQTFAVGFQSHAEGYSTLAKANQSHAEGDATSAITSAAHAEGWATFASGDSSHAEGWHSKAIGDASHAEGSATTASGAASHAEGSGTTASGGWSHAEGDSTSAITYAAHAEGWKTIASGDSSHAEGWECQARGGASHSEGYASSATGEASHAEGTRTIASGQSSHAEGSATTTYGGNSHAEGFYTTASGLSSHAEGVATKAYGNGSHSEGLNTIASGISSHAEGVSTVANNYGEHAEGRYNVSHAGGDEDATTIHSVGIGTDAGTGPRNAFEIMVNGDMYVYGLGGYSGDAIGGNVKTLQNVINNSGPKYVEIVPGLAVYNGMFIFTTNNATGTAQEICDAFFESIGQTTSYYGDNQKCKYALRTAKLTVSSGKVYTCFEDIADANRFAGDFCQDIDNVGTALDGYDITVDFTNNTFEIEGH